MCVRRIDFTEFERLGAASYILLQFHYFGALLLECDAMDCAKIGLDSASDSRHDSLRKCCRCWKYFPWHDRIAAIDSTVHSGASHCYFKDHQPNSIYFMFNSQYLTASELHAIMASGFATVSGTVLAAYMSYGAEASHLITSSVMAAPASLAFSKLFYPEEEESKTKSDNIAVEKS